MKNKTVRSDYVFRFVVRRRKPRVVITRVDNISSFRCDFCGDRLGRPSWTILTRRRGRGQRAIIRRSCATCKTEFAARWRKKLRDRRRYDL